VPGRHTWLLADPDSFGEVMANSVTVAKAARGIEPGPDPASRRIVAMHPADATHAVR
jgi:hypothetical protein